MFRGLLEKTLLAISRYDTIDSGFEVKVTLFLWSSMILLLLEVAKAFFNLVYGTEISVVSS